MGNPILENIITLYKDKKWKEIIFFLNTCDIVDIRRILWVLPNLKDISWITMIITENNLRGIASVGCGCGLLEWLIQQNTDDFRLNNKKHNHQIDLIKSLMDHLSDYFLDCDVLGIEIDQSWWCSKYSPPIFLENMIFVSDSESLFEVPEKYALIFCYFNNGPVFLKYLKEYKGNVIFVIGPDSGQNRYTNPLPFDQQFADHGWQLSMSREIVLSKDYICMYVR